MPRIFSRRIGQHSLAHDLDIIRVDDRKLGQRYGCSLHWIRRPLLPRGRTKSGLFVRYPTLLVSELRSLSS